MGLEFPEDVEVDVERLLDRVATYPSGDNCQPFRFEWDGSRLAVIYEVDRGAHRLNPGHILSWMTLGFVLETIDLAASEQGLDADWELPAGTPVAELPSVVRVRLARSGRAPLPLAAQLSRRRTVRAAYRVDSGLPSELAAQLLDLRREFQGAGIRLLPHPYPRELVRYFSDCDHMVWSDRLGACPSLS